VRELHEKLMTGVAGHHATPGVSVPFRTGSGSRAALRPLRPTFRLRQEKSSRALRPGRRSCTNRSYRLLSPLV
jgi:hypothetical protein